VSVGEVRRLRRVLGEVEELEGRGQRRVPDELPIALPDAAHRRLDVVDDLGTRGRRALADRGPDIDAVERLLHLVDPAPGQADERRVQIDAVQELVRDTPCLDAARPVGQSHDAAAALVDGRLAVAVRTVVGDGLGRRLPRHHGIGQPTIVAVEHDQRVPAHLPSVECLDDAADLVVHRRDHRHVGAAGGIGDLREPLQVLPRRLVRRMRRVEREVEVERLVGILVLDELDRRVAEQLRGVSRLAERLVLPPPVRHSEHLALEVVVLARKEPVEVVEAALTRPHLPVAVPDVPLADERRPVAGLVQRLGQRPLVGRQPVGEGGRNDEPLQAVAERIPPGHERRAGRRAHRRHVERLEPDPVGGQPVEVRRLDVR